MRIPSKPGIIITGANGFIGSYLLEYFQKKEYQITAFVHAIPKQRIQNVNYQLFDLQNDVPEEFFPDTDFLIHCAYIKAESNSNAMIINQEGTKRLLEASRKHNIKKFVFLSSFSAHEKAVSAYGKSKYETEKLFDPTIDLVLKPGLVVGAGGLFQKIVSIIKSSRIIPMIAGGRQPVQTLYINDLAQAIEKGMLDSISGTYPLAEAKAITMKEMYLQICAKENKKPVLVSVPFFVAHTGVFFFNLMGLNSPVSKENLLGLKYSKAYDISSSVETFKMNFKTFHETLKLI
jgi:nucleoside-diphosphate-sugar epimerase